MTMSDVSRLDHATPQAVIAPEHARARAAGRAILEPRGWPAIEAKYLERGSAESTHQVRH